MSIACESGPCEILRTLLHVSVCMCVCVSLGSFAVPGMGAWRVVRHFIFFSFFFSTSLKPRTKITNWSLCVIYIELRVHSVLDNFNFPACLKMARPVD